MSLRYTPPPAPPSPAPSRPPRRLRPPPAPRGPPPRRPSGAGAGAASRNRRVHPLRAARSGFGLVPHPVRGDGDRSRRDGVLQSDPQGERGERRIDPRPGDVQAAPIRAGERRGGPAERPSRGGPRYGLHPHSPAAPRPLGRRRPAADREDLPGPEELPARGDGPHRLHPHAGHPPQRGRAPGGIRGDRLQRAGADPHPEGRPPPGEPDAHRAGGAAGDDQGAEAGPMSVGIPRRFTFLLLLAMPVSAQQERTDDQRLAERAHQDRTIVYFLQPPETHSFDLYHDYTESRPGVDRYLNVVRTGSTSSKPAARVLDTGETLRVETVKGDDLRKEGLHPGETEEEIPP